jgi:hypothetical protein
LSAYELQRLEKIAANKRMFIALGVDTEAEQMRSALKRTKPASASAMTMATMMMMMMMMTMATMTMMQTMATIPALPSRFPQGASIRFAGMRFASQLTAGGGGSTAGWGARGAAAAAAAAAARSAAAAAAAAFWGVCFWFWVLVLYKNSSPLLNNP